MTGLEKYVGTSTVVGVDWLNFGGSALKAAGSAFGGGMPGAGQANDANAAALQAAKAQAAAAQQSASNWKLIGVGGIIALIIGYFALRKK